MPPDRRAWALWLLRWEPGGRRARNLVRLGSVVLTWMLTLAAGLTLLGAPVKGLADNGDFWRVTGPAGLAALDPPETTHTFVVRDYRSTAATWTGASSTSCLAWLAKHLPWPSTTGGTVDVRQLGLLCWLLGFGALLVGLYRGLSPPVVAAFAWVLADPGYLLFFNSFFGDVGLVLAVVGACVLLLLAGGRLAHLDELPRRSVWRLGAGLAAVGALGGLSKHQYILFPALLLVVCLLSIAVGSRRVGAARWALVGLAAVAVLAPLHFSWGSGHRFPVANRYNSVFLGAARASSDGPSVLKRLDIDPRFSDRIGVHRRHDDPIDATLREQLEDVSHLDVLGAWLAEPGAVVRMAAFIERAFSYADTTSLGHFERSTFPVKTSYRPALRYADVRAWILSAAPTLCWVVLAAALMWLVVRVRRRAWSGSAAAVSFLLLWTTSQMVVVVVGEGGHSLLRHLVGARVGLDLLAVLLLHRLASKLASVRKPPATPASADDDR